MTAPTRAVVHGVPVQEVPVHGTVAAAQATTAAVDDDAAVDDAAVDQAVAAGQPCLPGLGLLLDDVALSAVLRHHGWLAGTEQVRVDRLRLKPGTRAQAALRTTPGGRWLLAGTYSRDSWDKAGKDRDTARRRAQPVLVLPDLRVVITDAAADRDLPLLRELRPDASGGLKRHLVRVLAGGPVGTPPSAASTIAYNPARRWVGALRAPCGASTRVGTAARAGTAKGDWAGGDSATRPLALAKVYADPGTPGRAQAAAAVLAAAGVATPAAAERLPGLLVTAWVDGRTCDPGDGGDAAAVADVLARLASVRDAGTSRLGPAGAGLRPLSPRDLLHQASDAAAMVAAVLPDAAARADAVLRRLGTVLPALDAPPVTVHGDLSSDQILVGRQGPVVLDLDRAALGPPGWDGASWLAAQAAAGVPLRDLTGLPDVEIPGPLLAAAALLRAPEPWRRRRSGRAAATAALLDLAEAAVDPSPGRIGRQPRDGRAHGGRP